jgi:CheY-like chemotaxis protein
MRNVSSGRGKLVLVVEDDPDLADTMVDAVRLFTSARVVRARSTREALLLMRRETPDVALIDAGLPGDGWSLVGQLRADPDLCWVQVIGVSGIGPGGDPLARRAGCDDYLPKPFDLDNLLSTVERAWSPTVLWAAPVWQQQVAV